MKSLFEPEAYQEIINRLEQIQAEDQPKWGKMSVAQMMRHCQMPLELALGRMTIPKPNFFMRIVITSFKKSMYNDEPWKKNAPTLRQFRVADQRNFENEKAFLTELIHDFHDTRDQKERTPHPAFGHLTYDQWGQMQYKHLDHHLRQFGV